VKDFHRPLFAIDRQLHLRLQNFRNPDLNRAKNRAGL